MGVQFKKIVAIILVVTNIFVNAGFSVLASSVGDIVVEMENEDNSPKNYYYEYKEEISYTEYQYSVDALDKIEKESPNDKGEVDSYDEPDEEEVEDIETEDSL